MMFWLKKLLYPTNPVSIPTPSKLDYWKKWQVVELLDDLNKAKKILEEISKRNLPNKEEIDDFYLHLEDEIDDIEHSNKLDLSKIYIWFLPTSVWDELTMTDGAEIGNPIFERVSRWKKDNE